MQNVSTRHVHLFPPPRKGFHVAASSKFLLNKARTTPLLEPLVEGPGKKLLQSRKEFRIFLHCRTDAFFSLTDLETVLSPEPTPH